MKKCATATGVEHHVTSDGKWTACGHLVAEPNDPVLVGNEYMEITCTGCRIALRHEIERLQALHAVKPLKIRSAA